MQSLLDDDKIAWVLCWGKFCVVFIKTYRTHPTPPPQEIHSCKHLKSTKIVNFDLQQCILTEKNR